MAQKLSDKERRGHVLYFLAVVLGGIVLNILTLTLIAR
jgi:hypothetical protein